ncbi:UPF0041-domain-containing protein [Hyaloscypha bicolor E]|uniref:Mitochondrial pyruvate carrier n=1 Tax=Hyaloscypha bicolor E TaxID=1095630 RepID=A0A2J6TCV8_9HELO|nr:UPF0041-domain-containing protein [Hyaloscypha bicolor E]PMD60851.1 UPF0041-domain-containing protein [Hyaloscypha bicolor E]
MPAPSTLLRAARPAFRSQSQFFTAQSQAQAFRSTRARFQQQGRRWQSTATPAGNQSWAKRLWDSPIGVKTVHFWAPIMKWCLVLAGISDFYRPAEKLSLTQNVALTCTGLIWTRWCLIIKPRNIMLASVNFFLGLVGVVQVSRIVAYNTSQKKLTAGQQVEAAKEGAVESAQGLKKDVVEAVKS